MPIYRRIQCLSLSIENCIFINNEEETISCDFGSNLSVSNVLIDGGRNGIKSAQGGCEISVENTTIVNMWDPAIDIRDEAIISHGTRRESR